MASSKHGNNGRTVWAAQVMAGACIAAALLLSGCDSSSAEANKKAQEKADEAARLAASAGEMRASDKLVHEMEGKSSAEQDKTAQDIVGKIKADANNTGGVWKQYLDQRTVAEDLKLGMDALKKAPNVTDPGLQSALQLETGNISVQQAHEEMQEVEDKLTRLLEQALDIQNTGEYLDGLGRAADVQEHEAQIAGGGEAAKSNVAEAKASVTAAQQKVAALEQQIADKKAQASKIYSETDAAIEASEQMNGQEAIDHSKKAVEARREADSLTADVLNLQPELGQAKLDLSIAEIHAGEAEKTEAAMTAGIDRAKAAKDAATARAAALREQVKTLIEGTDGLAAKFTKFNDLAKSLEKDADEAGGYGTKADEAYGKALSQLQTYQGKVGELPGDWADPVKREVRMPEVKQFLQLGQAAAEEEVGRAYMLTVLAARYESMAVQAMANANKAAGITANIAILAPNENAAKATKAFDEANAMVDRVLASVPSSLDSNKQYDPGRAVNWLGLTLKAVALHGKYIVSNDASMLQMAHDAAEKARRLNPFLPLGSLAEGTQGAGSQP